jgi:hypothetical protein
MKVAILTCALLVAGCKSIDASSQKVMQGPFELTLGKGARWSHRHKGYDPDLPNHRKLAEIRDTKSPKPSETTEKVAKDTYFHFEVLGDRIHVILLPKAMKLLASQCKISWIDWYR